MSASVTLLPDPILTSAPAATLYTPPSATATLLLRTERASPITEQSSREREVRPSSEREQVRPGIREEKCIKLSTRFPGTNSQKGLKKTSKKCKKVMQQFLPAVGQLWSPYPSPPQKDNWETKPPPPSRNDASRVPPPLKGAMWDGARQGPSTRDETKKVFYVDQNKAFCTNFFYCRKGMDCFFNNFLPEASSPIW